MATCSQSLKGYRQGIGGTGTGTAPSKIDATLLTGGQDRHYAFGLAMSLVNKGVSLDIIGSAELDSPELHVTPSIRFLNLLGPRQRKSSLTHKTFRVMTYYARLLSYACGNTPEIFHILWNNKMELFDRTLLTLYYKCLRKKIILTAHNINAAQRDSTDSILNRLTLRIQYQLVDHIFVHTNKMKQELLDDFGVRDEAVTVIPYGINNAVPMTDLSPRDARLRLGLRGGERIILFFGALAPYKGLEYLVGAFGKIAPKNSEYHLIIVGKPKGGCDRYVRDIQEVINRDASRNRIIQKIGYVLDEDVETYFKAADLLVLPYTQIFQSGILFLGYSFGVPLIATDVGAFREDIIEGKTGFLCKPGDSDDLAETIEKYFASDLFRNLEKGRREIQKYVQTRHSWDTVGEMTRDVYAALLQKGGSRFS